MADTVDASLNFSLQKDGQRITRKDYFRLRGILM